MCMESPKVKWGGRGEEGPLCMESPKVKGEGGGGTVNVVHGVT